MTIATSTSREPASPVIYNVAIALGSNLCDSFRNIEYALRLLEYLSSSGGTESVGWAKFALCPHH